MPAIKTLKYGINHIYVRWPYIKKKHSFNPSQAINT